MKFQLSRDSRAVLRRNGKDPGPFLMIGVVVAAGIMIAFLVAFVLQNRHVEAHNEALSRSAEALANRTRLNTTATLARVNDMANLIAVGGVPTREGFQSYLKRASADAHFGLRQVAFVERVPRGKLDELIARERSQSGQPFRPVLTNPDASEFAIVTRTDTDIADQVGADISLVPGVSERLQEAARTRTAIYLPIDLALAGALDLLTDRPNLVDDNGMSLGGVVPVFPPGSTRPSGWLLIEIDVERMAGNDETGSLEVLLSPQDPGDPNEIGGGSDIGGHSTNRLESSFAGAGIDWRVAVISDDTAGIGLPSVVTLLVGVLLSLIVGLFLAAQRRAVDASSALNRSEHERRHDALTGLPNRVGVAEALATALEERDTRGHPAAVLFCDIDRFKVVNDSLGHQVGDELLCILARRLRSSVRPSDVVGRYGGDEFVVICPKLADIDEARLIARRIAERVATPIRLAGTEIEISTSVGIAFAEPSANRRGDELVRDADVAMYAAKHDRSTIRVFDDSLRQSTLDRLAIEHALRASLKSGRIHLEFQPIVSARRHTIEALEALARFDDPVLVAAGAKTVVAVADEIGVMDVLGDQVLEMACAQLAAWHELRPDGPPVQLSVNVSEAQMRQPGFETAVRNALERNALDPHQLILELSEAAALADTKEGHKVVDGLARLGVEVSVDDFGTGQASLTQIATMRSVSELKIDRSLVGGEGGANVRALLLSAIREISAGLGTRLVAKGVETQEELGAVSVAGVERAQGFLFSQPLSASAVRGLLEDPDARLRPQPATGAEPHPAVPGADA